ncbi:MULTISPECIES: zonular occludens toxin domain-containing protein [Bacteria]|uniref:zonular occludens toxin domain-containing protein n=1 Tax=Bacteria TaxID=2 RepID=UPI00384DBCB6
MMYLISGQPGNGKSLRALYMMEQAYLENQQAVKEGKAQPRRFYTNMAGATLDENPDAFPWVEKIPEHNDWTKLPDGAYVLYDEAHSDGKTPGLERYGYLFPSTGKPGESDDPRIRAMSTHRHRGVDLVFVTQWPSKIHHQVRTLIGSHTHMNRAFGMQRAGVLTWSRVQSDPYDEKMREKAEEEIWAYPKHLYKRYKSSTMHTASHKFKVPARVWQGLSVFVFLVLALWGIYAFVIKPQQYKGKETMEGEGAKAGGVALAPLGAGSPPAAPRSREEYVDLHKPRVEFQPWSAPAYDDRRPVAKPELYCMSSGTDVDRTCSCITEQGTKYRLPMDMCIAIALQGPQYNPYREPAQQQAAPASGSVGVQQVAPGVPVGVPAGALIGVGERAMGTFPESTQNRYGGG